MKNTPRIRGSAALLALALSLAAQARAGALLDLHNASAGVEDPGAQSALFEVRAAEAGVQTEQRRHLPRVVANARSVRVYQDIQQSGNPVFQSGHTDYNNTRLGVLVEQTLIDPTIRPLVDAARARLRRAEAAGRFATEAQTRVLVEGYLRAARLQDLLASADRVVARLEKELDAVTKSQEAKVATLTEVQNIRLSLAAARRERGNLALSLNQELGALGAGQLKATDRLPAGADFAAFAAAPASGEGAPAESAVLRAEAEEAGHQARASRNRSLPVLSLVAEYGIDDAGGSLFGGPRDFSYVEGGVAVKWAIFDRGMNYSEARQFAYRQRAKEAEMKAAAKAEARADANADLLLARAAEGAAELAALAEESRVLMDASARAYAAGQDSYLNSITSYLAYESATRDAIAARHDHLARAVARQGRVGGWNDALVRAVDALFVPAAK